MRTLSIRAISIVLVSVHAIAFLLFLLYFLGANERDGQAMLLWTYWLVIDFPVSVLVLVGWWLIDPDSHRGAALSQYWLYFVHGVVGTIWWYYIPQAATFAFRATKTLLRRQ